MKNNNKSTIGFVGILVLMTTLCFVSIPMFAQLNIGGEPYSFNNELTTDQTPIKELPRLDYAQLEKEDEEAESFGEALRFGFKHPVNYTLENSGVWESLPNGDRVWRLKIHCPEALSINLLYDHYWLPSRSVLYVYSSDGKQLIGGFTERNNKGTSRSDKRGFGSTLIYDETVVLEYYEPNEVRGQGIISLSEIVHGYRYIPGLFNGTGTGSHNASGNCQVNINCSPEGDDWQDEKRGVAAILVNGNAHCTGSLLNNVLEDCTPYFLTADHCLTGNAGANLDNWSFLWNYESAGCANGTSVTVPCTNGATVLANRGVNLTDFGLVLLDESPVDGDIDVYFNGWSRTNSPPSGGVGIHHPAGDIKKISTHTMVPIGNSACPPDPNDYWEIDDWIATTNGHSVQEPGSSGSPLFTSDHFIIGQLSGPRSCPIFTCNGPQQVVYGRISTSWDGANAQTRLRDWLDPNGTNPNQLAGAYPPCLLGCPEDLVLNDNPITPGDYQAEFTITSAGTVASGTDVDMKAGEAVTLLPNFIAEEGCTFIARIGPCENFTAPPPQGLNQSDNQYANDRSNQLDENAGVAIKNYPNPFSDFTVFELSLKNNSNARLEIFDFSGQLIATLIDNEILEQGSHSIQFNAKNLANGIYMYRFSTDEESITQKMILSR